jgi:hypothetical protein
LIELRIGGEKLPQIPKASRRKCSATTGFGYGNQSRNQRDQSFSHNLIWSVHLLGASVPILANILAVFTLISLVLYLQR